MWRLRETYKEDTACIRWENPGHIWGRNVALGDRGDGDRCWVMWWETWKVLPMAGGGWVGGSGREAAEPVGADILAGAGP